MIHHFEGGKQWLRGLTQFQKDIDMDFEVKNDVASSNLTHLCKITMAIFHSYVELKLEIGLSSHQDFDIQTGEIAQ